jgi:hypothetical protein
MIDFHDIISVETKTIYSDTPEKRIAQQDPVKPGEPRKGKGKSQPARRKDRPKGDTFLMSILRVIGVLIIMGVLYFAWTVYRVQYGERF